MNRFQLFVCLCIGGMTLMSASLQAQLELPRKSPKAGISFTTGFTEVKINYSSPSAGDREIWGALVPYDQIWRAGANEATTIEFSTNVKVEGQDLPKGRYSFFLIPREVENWTAIFNKVPDQWGAYNYKEEEDALRVDVKTRDSRNKEERLTYTIEETDIDRGRIRMAWGNKVVTLRFEAEVLQTVAANVEEAIAKAKEEDKWKIYAQVADYLYDGNRYADVALEYAQKSTALYDHSRNWWIKAKIEAKKRDLQAAIQSAEKSAMIGQANDDDQFYANSKDRIDKAVAEWKTQLTKIQEAAQQQQNQNPEENKPVGGTVIKKKD